MRRFICVNFGYLAFFWINYRLIVYWYSVLTQGSYEIACTSILLLLITQWLFLKLHKTPNIIHMYQYTRILHIIIKFLGYSNDFDHFLDHHFRKLRWSCSKHSKVCSNFCVVCSACLEMQNTVNQHVLHVRKKLWYIKRVGT